MRYLLAQINTTVGDLEGNLALAKKIMSGAEGAGADLVIFPELSVVGYPPKDLLDKPAFVEASIEYARQWAELSKDIAMIFGGIAKIPYGGVGGKKLFNVAYMAEDGKISTYQPKSLLPSYDVFDEDRHFKPADYVEPIKFKGKKLGVCICEDIWNDKDFWNEKRNYDDDPIKTLADQGAEIIINLSASPWAEDKQAVRHKMLSHTAEQHRLPIIYVNQVGGNDDVVYDGASLVMGRDGRIKGELASFSDDWGYVDIEGDLISLGAGMAKNVYEVSRVDMMIGALIIGVKDYSHKCGFKKAVIGLSGGIDSAVTAAIAASAMGSENVLGVSMPSKFSSEGSKSDAASLAENLGISFETKSIRAIYDVFRSNFSPDSDEVDLALENLQARIRGAMLMAFSNREGRLLLTTGNKSEVAVGYCTLYGDTCGGLAVLSDVYKTDVYAIAKRLNEVAEREIIPMATIEKPPSAELRPDQKDTDSLPPYDVLDAILRSYIEDCLPVGKILSESMHLAAVVGSKTVVDAEMVERVCRMVDRNEYKRKQLAPGIRVTNKAFGSGRLMPIAQKWMG